MAKKVGTVFDDALVGTAFEDAIYGLDGSDELYGKEDDDYLDGGAGQDYLDGGPGADTMVGGDDGDGYWVDNPDDQVIETGTSGLDRVYTDLSGYTLPDGVEGLAYAGTGAISAIGNALANEMDGGDMGDSFWGGAGTDYLGGHGGKDTLNGGADNDMLWGGEGEDTLTGGSGADIFQFLHILDSPTGASDTITDFIEGMDLIDLTDFDANAKVAGDQDFTFIGSGPFTGDPGELQIMYAKGNTYVNGDVTGDGLVDLQIEVLGTINFAASDFML